METPRHAGDTAALASALVANHRTYPHRPEGRQITAADYALGFSSLVRLGWPELKRAMWPLAVVMVDVDAQHALEMAVIQDQQPVETLGAHGPDEAFRDRVRLRRPHRCLHDPDALAAEDLVEGPAVLAVAITNQEADAMLCIGALHAADRPEREVALPLLARALRGGETIVCDKGYAGREFATAVQTLGATIARPARRNGPNYGPHLAPIRQRIESVFAICKDLLTLERHGARTPHNLSARIATRLLALAACISLNHQLGRPSRAIADYAA